MKFVNSEDYIHRSLTPNRTLYSVPIERLKYKIKTFSKKKVNELNRGIKRMQQIVFRVLLYPELSLSSLQFRVYADASFAINDDLSSQLGYVNMLYDKSNKFHVLDFSNKKSKLVLSFVMAAEVYAFMDAIDTMTVTVTDSSLLLKKSVPVHMFTDMKQLFDSIALWKRAIEKRLEIDLKKRVKLTNDLK